MGSIRFQDAGALHTPPPSFADILAHKQGAEFPVEAGFLRFREGKGFAPSHTAVGSRPAAGL